MYYAVIDTNVLISATLKANSIPSYIILEALQGSIIPILNDQILEEYTTVLRRPKFNFSEDIIEKLISGLILRGVFFDGLETNDNVIDPKDVVFYQVTLEAREYHDAFLVTGNSKHFPVKSFIVTPKEMMDLISGETNQP